MKHRFIITAVMCSTAISFAQEATLKGKTDYHSLEDATGRAIEAKILYVGDQWTYLQRSFKKPQRIRLNLLSDSSRELLNQWNATYGTGLSADELRLVAKIAYASSPAQPLVVDPDPAKQWKLNNTFSDEFNAKKLDEEKWSRNLHPWGERAWRADNVWQKKGHLFIQAKYDRHTTKKGDEYFYTLGILQSNQKTTYGYFEARIKGCSRFPGLCPAFWLYSNGKDLSPEHPHITYSEIDIVEMLQRGYDPVQKRKTGPKHIDCNLHTREMIDGVETWRRPQHWPEVCRNVYNAPWNPSDDFHLYACENTPEKITWYIDGIKVAESPNHNWHLPMSVTLTMELRPPLIAWAGDDGRAPVPEESVKDGFPTHMEVDYVRCWTLAE
ncbi:kappa-carrageenase [Pontiella sulfatireligans]|uniref:Kappa-carrageenase n=1 Tax=Pontiella sulfatireligans TaxID=2750658 RepID=A0A6C2UTL0_9BACT|nr:kappa-carrageenase [Pontiella sulfatireligans]VGO23499.1 Kappa-carrageenase [Pontiella sulfatireligans]